MNNLPPVEISVPGFPVATNLFVDAGVETIRFYLTDASGSLLQQRSTPASLGISAVGTDIVRPEIPVFFTGKLQEIIGQHFTHGKGFSSLAVLWSAAAEQAVESSVAILDLSASGYVLVGVNNQGQLKDNLLVTNSRCGSGSGINLDRVLRKLSIEREQVDPLLVNFLGETGRSVRQDIPVRADRCGVFASSATISDKNQGIPLDFALATTLKSEVLKACNHFKTRIDKIYLTGGVFRWQFTRDCAADYFAGLGIDTIIHDESHGLILQGLQRLSRGWKQPHTTGVTPLTQAETATKTYPSFVELHKNLSARKLFRRQSSETQIIFDNQKLRQPVFIGIDVGSTMAKVIISAADSQAVLHRAAYSNAGDTIETVKEIFHDLLRQGITALNVVRLGLTGSARYQIQQALIAVYPSLADRVTVLVENYAHARGSVALARQYLIDLEDQGVENLNKDICLLVDVGGEDTKISSIDLLRGDLYDNVMNTKCSAGTGSLLDTLVDLFSLDDIGIAVSEAMLAPRVFALNATCAVFLLEHVRKLQAAGCRRDEILASAVWAIVENMARSLWPQIHMPANILVLLHGQTMQSDPIPLAISERLQSFLGGSGYCLVPEHPGHRACLGLIQTLAEQPAAAVTVTIPLRGLIEQTFSRQIIQCHGAVCGDRNARCYRSKLTATDATGLPFSISLGGCAAINELPKSRLKSPSPVRDTCRDIWQFQVEKLPISEAANRLVIPRSFAVSEWGRFFASLFESCDIPVHVDAPTEQDILRGQTHFRVDTCAPHIGVVGQFLRLAEQPHGIILAPQISFLPVTGKSLGRTCTINQGGFATAQGLARVKYPQSRIELFYLDLKSNLDLLAHKLYSKLLSVYHYYAVEMPFERFLPLVHQAMADQLDFRRQTADYAAKLAREAQAAGQKIALVVGREYILNPGIYDSHVGRLLRDKGLVGIPGYVLNANCDPKLSHLYWRNAHIIASLAGAVAQKKLHTIIPHQGLKKIIAKYEQGDDLLPIIQVSTFLCGPDSVTNPLINEMVKNRPFLRIQSDAAIKELAHLENRMNTYVNQLAANKRQQFDFPGSPSFDVELLDELTSREPINRETDLICFPTLGDNRALLAVIRGAGFDCLENYGEDYNLQALIEQGRSIAGDSVCAPLAAVYGDVLNAINNFQRSLNIDPAIKGKKRLLIFNNKGLGPCRQGQYVETHKLFLQQTRLPETEDRIDADADRLVQFLVAHENEGFNTGFPGWVFLRGVQATILQGVLHQLLAEGSARCRSENDYQKFLQAYVELKETLNRLIETSLAPSEKALRWCHRVRNLPGIYHLIAFFGWGFHRNPLLVPLRIFRQSWCRNPIPDSHIRIHIDGEAYMRTAQFEVLHQEILEILGSGRFHLTYTPLWGFLEYKLAGMLMRAKEGIAESRLEIGRGGETDFILKRKKFLRKKQKRYLTVSATHFFLRQVLAAPLYRAAGIPLPEALPKVLEMAKKVISTRRPGGELIPYVGEAALKLQKGYDLVLNIAPEGCMVSSMGEVITPAIYEAVPGSKGKIQPIFSQQGDVDREKLHQALLQALGPEKVYGLN